MEKIKDFLLSRTPITDTVAIPSWLFIVLFLVALLLVIVIISATQNYKKEKNKKTFSDTTDVITFLDDETATDKVEDTNATTSEETTQNLNVEETAQNLDIAVDGDSTKCTIESEETTLKTEATEEPQEKETPHAELTFPSEEIKEAAEEQLKEEIVAAVVEEEKPSAITTESKQSVPTKNGDAAKVSGKIEICNSAIGGFRYTLRANNGQLLYESRDYKTERSCVEAVEKFIHAVTVGNFSVKADKFNRYKFILKSPTSNNLIYVGESFATNAACLSNIESVKRFAANSVFEDTTQTNCVVPSKVYQISDEIKELVKNPNGIIGKWAIEKYEEDTKPSFVFLLYANNGQLLYESRDYASYSSCKNGVQTFIKTIKDGDFYIDPDKSGRYKFVLRNKNNNSLMEYIGPNYSTEKAACNNADSVYRFALISSTDNL